MGIISSYVMDLPSSEKPAAGHSCPATHSCPVHVCLRSRCVLGVALGYKCEQKSALFSFLVSYSLNNRNEYKVEILAPFLQGFVRMK